MFFQILLHTPSWVWLVLALLLWRGYSMTRPQRVPRARVALLPALLVLLSLAGVISTFGQHPAALLCWAAGMALSAYETRRRGFPAGAVYLARERSYELRGSWVPLLLIALIFTVKYSIGALLALHPQLREVELFTLVTSAVYGVLSGVFAGRALRLWQLQRTPGLALDAMS